MSARVAVAGFSGRPEQFSDDELLVERLAERAIEASSPNWDDPSTDWNGFDLVVARSPWDYTTRLEEFLAWTRSIRVPLENSADVIAWNSDKTYMADLREAGVPIVETEFVRPNDAVPAIEFEVVIKPTLSAGARNTGRFRPERAEEAVALIELIQGMGRTAMVQPFLASVETAGETAVVMLGGEVSHVLRKGSLLSPDEVAPIRTDDALNVAEIMYDPDLVVPGTAEEDELALARSIIGVMDERFGSVPLVARIDMLRDGDGSPALLELEAIEPNLYFSQVPEAADRLADAIEARLERGDASTS